MRRINPTSLYLHLLLLLVLWALLLLHINAPWLGHHDANGVWLSSAARNLRLYGPAQITLTPLLNRAPVPPDLPNYYVHHPPLVVWVTAMFETVFGEHEMAARLGSVFATMISVAAFAVLCHRLFGCTRGLVCAVLYALTPMIIYFGRMPNHEPLSLAFLMLFGAVFVDWVQRPTTRRWWTLAVLAFVAVWTAWASLFVVLALSVFGLWVVSPTQRVRLIALGGVGFVAVVSIVMFYSLQYPDTLNRLLYAFSWRTSTRSEISESFTTLEFVGTTILHTVNTATLALSVLTPFGLLLAFGQNRRLGRAVLLAFGAAGLTYIVLFRSASYVHDYYKIYLLPCMAMAAGGAVVYAWQHRSLRSWGRPALMVLFGLSTVIAVLVTSRWYAPERDAVMLGVAKIVAEHSSPADTVFTNLIFNPPLEYYAFRKMVWAIKADEVGPMAAVAAPAVYLYCPWFQSGGLEHPASDAEAVAACTITRLS